MEIDFALSSAGGQSGNILGIDLPTRNAISAALPASTRGAKFRVTSLVVDPVHLGTDGNFDSLGFSAYDLNMLISDNHYQPASIDKPLRVRFSNAYGSDGMWCRTDATGGGVVDPFLNGSTPIGTIQVDVRDAGSAFGDTEVHIRVAFTDL